MTTNRKFRTICRWLAAQQFCDAKQSGEHATNIGTVHYISAASSQLCQRIQKEWANVEVSRNELLIQMMLYMILCFVKEILVMWFRSGAEQIMLKLIFRVY